MLQILFRSECEAEGITIAPDDDGVPARLNRFQVMGVLSSLAKEKKCAGTSRLEKIENLTQMFLYPVDGSSEDAAELKAIEEGIAPEFEVDDAAGDASAVDDSTEIASALIPSYARPLNRGWPSTSGIRIQPLDAPELPYLAPKILRSPAKNAHISDEHNKTTRWNVLQMPPYDAEALLREMLKTTGKSENDLRKPGQTIRSLSSSFRSSNSMSRHVTVSSDPEKTGSVKFRSLAAPLSPHSPSQSANRMCLLSSPRGRKAREKPSNTPPQKMICSAHTPSPPAVEIEDESMVLVARMVMVMMVMMVIKVPHMIQPKTYSVESILTIALDRQDTFG